MRLLRSWPARIPEGRNYVTDSIDRLVISNHDYRPLGGIDDDVLLLEWDIAVDLEQLQAFAERARERTGRVLVAPYRIPADLYHLPAPCWAHRRWDGTGQGTVVPEGARPVETGDATCNLFGLGMCYLPRALVRRFLADGYATHFGDKEFSMWHYQRVTRDVPIMWAVRPVHLNYLIPDLEEAPRD
jgi:hypothetical protein